MRAEVLESYVSHTTAAMYEQTRLKPGGFTGKCHPFVVGALTGEDVDYSGLPPDIEEQYLMEERYGLVRHSVILSKGMSALHALAILLEEEHLSFDTLLVGGSMQGLKSMHVIAIVFDTDVLGLHHVIDSQLPHGIISHTAALDTVTHIGSKLKSDRMSLDMVQRGAKPRYGSSLEFLPISVAEGVVINTRVYTQV